MKSSIVTLILVACFFINMNFSEASSHKFINCSLPENTKITIGCTSKCQLLNKMALKKAAKKLGYSLSIKDISTTDRPINFAGIDGILVQAGPDINPKYYTEFLSDPLRSHIKSIAHYAKLKKKGKKRDIFESDFLSAYLKSSSTAVQITPILGIGRGMQMLSVAHEIPLYVDIKKELGIKNRRFKLDKINITEPASIISDIAKKDKFRGTKFHHQALRLDYFNSHREWWPDLAITATSKKGKIAEVLESFAHPILGVQFRPDIGMGKVRKGIYAWLLNRACHKKNFTPTL